MFLKRDVPQAQAICSPTKRTVAAAMLPCFWTRYPELQLQRRLNLAFDALSHLLKQL